MTSPKLLLVLMAAASSLAAPQIRENQVVGDVLAQLQPMIAQAIAGLNLGGSSVSASAPASRFSVTSPAVTTISRIPSRPIAAVRRPVSSSTSFNSITSSVVNSLQPSIADAVARALAGSSRGPAVLTASRERTKDISIPAKYEYSYQVSDDESQAYMAHRESRDGNDVTGSYNYIDPTGALVTVNYMAGPEGYTETRNVEKGAVVMRHIPGAWTGPLAGVDDIQDTTIAARATGATASTGLSQSDLIAQILASIQPRINTAVQSALGSSSSVSRASGAGQRTVVVAPAPVVRVAPAPVVRVAPAPVVRVAPAPVVRTSSSLDGGLVSSVISSLGPSISAAVQSALSSTRTVSAPRPRPRVQVPRRRPVPVQTLPVSGSNDLASVFGVGGENSVKFETPNFEFHF